MNGSHDDAYGTNFASATPSTTDHTTEPTSSTIREEILIYEWRYPPT